MCHLTHFFYVKKENMTKRRPKGDQICDVKEKEFCSLLYSKHLQNSFVPPTGINIFVIILHNYFILL